MARDELGDHAPGLGAVGRAAGEVGDHAPGLSVGLWLQALFARVAALQSLCGGSAPSASPSRMEVPRWSHPKPSLTLAPEPQWRLSWVISKDGKRLETMRRSRSTRPTVFDWIREDQSGKKEITGKCQNWYFGASGARLLSKIIIK